MKISISVLTILVALIGNSIAVDEAIKKRIDDAFMDTRGIVDLEFQKIGEEGARYIAEKIKNNRNITSLNLWDNKIGYEGASAIADVLNSTFITYLDLGANYIGVKGIAVILRASKYSNIDDLRLDVVARLGEWEGIPLAALLENSKMSTLSLRLNELNATYAKVIAGVLDKTRITSLNLDDNPLGTEGVSAILTACKNYPMKHLGLTSTAFGQWEDIPIASLLVDTKITSLALSFNRIQGETAAKIVEATKHTRITYLDLSDNGITGMKISGALNYSNITNLNLKRCGIDDAGVSELAKVLPNTCIVDLNLESNEFRDNGVENLAKALPNTLITNLLLLIWDPPMDKSLEKTVEIILKENKVRIDELYDEFKELVVERNGSLEFDPEIDHQRRVNFTGIISGKGRGYIEHFSRNEDRSFTREQIEEFILNVEKQLNPGVGVSPTPGAGPNPPPPRNHTQIIPRNETFISNIEKQLNPGVGVSPPPVAGPNPPPARNQTRIIS